MIYTPGFCANALQGSVQMHYRVLCKCITGFCANALQGSVQMHYRVLYKCITGFCTNALQGSVQMHYRQGSVQMHYRFLIKAFTTLYSSHHINISNIFMISPIGGIVKRLIEEFLSIIVVHNNGRHW
jgi:hypothetical protein